MVDRVCYAVINVGHQLNWKPETIISEKIVMKPGRADPNLT